jgi:hypothetical protein
MGQGFFRMGADYSTLSTRAKHIFILININEALMHDKGVCDDVLS